VAEKGVMLDTAHRVTQGGVVSLVLNTWALVIAGTDRPKTKPRIEIYNVFFIVDIFYHKNIKKQ